MHPLYTPKVVTEFHKVLYLDQYYSPYTQYTSVYNNIKKRKKLCFFILLLGIDTQLQLSIKPDESYVNFKPVFRTQRPG